jgi:hypothetical protein|tara:strand:+ start:95 stop:568 length:474 start_codon:yes stop_codon:yes gene_type:complete
MNKREEYLYHLEEFYSKGSELIEWDDTSNFERSYKLNRKLAQVKDRVAYLHKWRLTIGQQVYISKKGWNYTLVTGHHLLEFPENQNYDTSHQLTFTEEIFDRLCLDYLSYSIEFLLKYLLERELSLNSTSKINNLVFEWDLQCKQELIREFKNAIDR